MKKLIFLFLLGITTYSNAQNFDIADFNQKLEVAEWLSVYDKIAWWTSDSVMAQPQEQLA